MTYKPEYVSALAAEIMAYASRYVVMRTAIAAVVGAVIGGVVGASTISTSFGVILGAFVAGLYAYSSGQEKVLTIRAQAQLMLTQLEIEQNTRPLRRYGQPVSAAAPARPSSPAQPTPMPT